MTAVFDCVKREVEGFYGPSPDKKKRGVIFLDEFMKKDGNLNMLLLYYKVKAKSRYVTVVCRNSMYYMKELVLVLASLRKSGFHTAAVLDATAEDVFFMDDDILESLVTSSSMLVLRGGKGVPESALISPGFSNESMFKENVTEESLIIDCKHAMENKTRFFGYRIKDLDWLAFGYEDELVYVVKNDDIVQKTFVNRFVQNLGRA